MTAEDAVARAFRSEWAAVVSALIRRTGDWDLAEECAQDAFVKAARTWSVDGVPDNPGAWLTTVARNRAIDVVRRRAADERRQQRLFEQLDSPPPEPADSLPDDRLRLIFTCCHPALPMESRVALTLRTLAGLTTAEVARAFLVPEPTMAKRLVRAKNQIKTQAIPFTVPAPDRLHERTAAVLAVLYLLFNEGYTAAAGDELQRTDVAQEAIRLTELVHSLLPSDPEVGGLLALMLLTHARRAARTGPDGQVVLLADQDRSRWDTGAIERGVAVLSTALAAGRRGPYQLQASIAACHSQAPTADATDWNRISELYGHLATIQPSPVVQLNRAVALSVSEGPAAALPLVESLRDAPGMAKYHLLHATHAHLLRRLGRPAEALARYQEALACAPTHPEREHLRQQICELAAEI